ncbi:hypothetical protein [Enhygromyxa salina]|nr:hypothetical protein [Enhygromyxa salina]
MMLHARTGASKRSFLLALALLPACDRSDSKPAVEVDPPATKTCEAQLAQASAPLTQLDVISKREWLGDSAHLVAAELGSAPFSQVIRVRPEGVSWGPLGVVWEFEEGSEPLHEQTVDRLGDEIGRHSDETIALAIAPDVPWARVVAVADVVVDAGVTEVVLLFRGPAFVPASKLQLRAAGSPMWEHAKQLLAPCPEATYAFGGLGYPAQPVYPDFGRDLLEALGHCGCAIDIQATVELAVSVAMPKTSVDGVVVKWSPDAETRVSYPAQRPWGEVAVALAKRRGTVRWAMPPPPPELPDDEFLDEELMQPKDEIKRLD